MMSEFVFKPKLCRILAAELRPKPIPAVEHLRGAITTLGVIELLLKNPARLNELLRDETLQRELIPNLLAAWP